MKKPNIKNNTDFIYQLDIKIQFQIIHDLQEYSIKNKIKLEIDSETGNYLALSDRFCYIEDIYM